MSQLPALIERRPSRQSEPTQDSSPIVRIQKTIFLEAAALGASDIHIEPGRVCTRVRCRIHGALQQTAELPRWLHDNLVVRIKVLASLDVAERRVPQDGHINAEATGTDDARVSTIPTRWGPPQAARPRPEAVARSAACQDSDPMRLCIPAVSSPPRSSSDSSACTVLAFKGEEKRPLVRRSKGSGQERLMRR